MIQNKNKSTQPERNLSELDIGGWRNIFSIFPGCIRRTGDIIQEDYDEIDRKSPPLFINNTRTKLVVASGKTASLECRVENLDDRTVSYNLRTFYSEEI